MRLPTDIVPVHYELHLKVYLPFRPSQLDFGPQNFTVDGNLRLLLLCRAATNILTLHAKALDIEHAKTAIWEEESRAGGSVPRVVGWRELAGGNDLLELRLDKAICQGGERALEGGGGGMLKLNIGL